MPTGRDRTDEFKNIVKTIVDRQSRSDGSSQTLTNCRRYSQPAVEQRNTFIQHTQKIGQDLSQTFLKLEQLILITKQSSLFNDRSMEIEDLTQSIKQKICNLNQQIGQLHQYVQNTTGSPLKNSQTHTNTVVFALQSNLVTMSDDFRQVLVQQTQHLKEQKSRRDKFSRNTTASLIPVVPSSTNDHLSVLLRDDHDGSKEVNTIIDIDSSAIELVPAIYGPIAYTKSRLKAIQHIEQAITEVGDIFNRLSNITRQQQEFLDRIDDNVNVTTTYIIDAHRELLTYLLSVTSNRWFIVKVFAVLIVFFLIFIVFLA